NLLSLRANQQGVDLPNAVARGMTWGAFFLALFALARGSAFTFEWTASYLASLVYLAVPGSVIAFLAYLSLVRRIGADRAAYATVLFPVVALTVSTLFEGYRWTAPAAVGFALVLAGNLLVLVRRRPGKEAAA